MTKFCSWLLAALLTALLAACGGGGDDGMNIPADAKVCQMQFYGVAIWEETRPPSELEKKTFTIDVFNKGFAEVGGSYDQSVHRLFLPRMVILDSGKGWALLRVEPPNFYPGPPLAPAMMRVTADAYEGYRYGRIWSCMTEELSFGDEVYIRASGDETVPTDIQITAYTAITSWGNTVQIPSGALDIKYFAVPGDSVSLDLR